LEKELHAIQEDSPSTHFAPENRDGMLPGKIKIDFLFCILVKTDAHVRCRRSEQEQGFSAQVSSSMIKRLTVFPFDCIQIVKIHGTESP
jgi:hypothetical protein